MPCLSTIVYFFRLAILYRLNHLTIFTGNWLNAKCVMPSSSINGLTTITIFSTKMMTCMWKMSSRGQYNRLYEWNVANTPYIIDAFTHRQALVTRVDQDFDIRRVQTQAEKFIPKVESVNHNRKRKSTAATKPNSSSSVRWVCQPSTLPIRNVLFLQFQCL